MKKLIVFFLIVQSFLIQASYWEKRVSGWDETIDNFIQALEAAKDNSRAIFYPELSDRVRNLFPEEDCTKIDISHVENGKKTKNMTVYISGSSIEIVSHAAEGWNLSTDGNEIYEWKYGAAEGLKIRRNNEHLVSYLYYLTDPSWMMADMYREYLDNPDATIVRKNLQMERTEIEFKEPIYGFEAVYVSGDPLWFLGFRVVHDGKTQEFLVSEPILMQKIPESIRKRRSEIRFKESDKTLERHMVFL